MAEKKKQKKQRKTLREKRAKSSSRWASASIIVVVVILGLVVSIHGRTLSQKNQEYQIKEERLQMQLELENERKSELEEKRIYVKTKQYIEEVAKEKLGLVKPDEIILKPAD